MIKEERLPIKRTARYYTLGELNSQTQNIWFVLHGYGQLAGAFIKTFDELSDNHTVIIAPEALSRFYIDGGNGKIGASWMTKEDRENEIKDYVNYLDEVLSHIVASNKISEYKINALGFSQGVATLSRWAVLGKSRIDKIIFWAGEISGDLGYSKLNDREIHLVFGNNDFYFPGEFYKTQEKLLDSSGIKYKTHIFDGIHEVNVKIMKQTGLI